MNHMDTPEFKEAFWKWFDNLPREEKRRFQEFKSDMAELFFYNKIYEKTVDTSRDIRYTKNIT